jgi:hypothetical protein
VEFGGLLASNKVRAHWTQTQTANSVNWKARQNTIYCPTMSKEKRTIGKHVERKRARKSWAACTEKRNAEASATKRCWTCCTDRRLVMTRNRENNRNPTISRLNDLSVIVALDFSS